MPLDKGKAVQRDTTAAAPIFRRPDPLAHRTLAPSSSGLLTSDPFVPLPPSSFSPPSPPARTTAASKHAAPRILAAEISPSALRPLAFRIFTKKHNLTLKSDALNLLCVFIGHKCGSDWRDSGSGEKLLDEVARMWKRNAGPGGILVDGGDALQVVLRGMEVPRGVGGAGTRLPLGRERSFDISLRLSDAGGDTPMNEGDDSEAMQELLRCEGGAVPDPKKYLKVIGAFSQPKWVFNPLKKHYERGPKPTLLPEPQIKTQLLKQRYHVLHQRLLRNESFLPPTFSAIAKRTSTGISQHYTITSISHLLGQHSSTFLLFGVLTIAPTGVLSLTDPTGSISLDLTYATPVPLDGAYFTPGCFVLVDGVYSEDPMKFTVLTIGMPPCERREASAEIFGHVDFLGTGLTIDPATVQNKALRRMETIVGCKWIFLSEVELDVDRTFDALRAVFEEYGSSSPPLVCVLMGNFIRVPFGGSLLGRASTTATQGSISYKENWDRLALLLSDFPSIVKSTTFIFVPGDNDPFTSTFSGGRAALLPREAIPEYFVNRVKRVLTTGSNTSTTGLGVPPQQNVAVDSETRGGVWTTNPARVSYLSQEIVLFRDDALARFSRSAVRFPKVPTDAPTSTPTSTVTTATAGTTEQTTEPEPMNLDLEQDHTNPLPTLLQPPLAPPLLKARKLVKTLLDQGHLSPFPLTVRPLLWDFAPHTLSLYPLPSLLVLADTGIDPFAVTYEGCHVVNPGRLLPCPIGGGSNSDGVRGGMARWVEYDVALGRGTVREAQVGM